MKRRNIRGKEEFFFSGEHMSVEVLKLMRALRGSRYLFEDVPPYPEEVEFTVDNVSYVTTKSRLERIIESAGFQAREGTDLAYWNLHVQQSDVQAAEKRYIDNARPPPLSAATHDDQTEPFRLSDFTKSPAFADSSRYGNCKFTFPIKRLVELYQEQFCCKKEPQMRIYETVVESQEIMYTVLVHSPETTQFNEYPALHGQGDQEAICSYDPQTHTVTWRAQAICHGHSKELLIGLHEGKTTLRVKDTEREKFCMWDHVLLAFHLPDDKVLKVERSELFKSLTACYSMFPYLGDEEGDFPNDARRTIHNLRFKYNVRN